jgi:ribosomal-protein-alanine N-acetyltransferase
VTISSNWRDGLPVILGAQLTLRELQLTDAPSLHLLLTAEEVTRFVSPPPASIEEFERFIEAAHAARRSGLGACFAVVPNGMQAAVGMFQIRQRDADFGIAEWDFAIGSAFWGTGVFADAAPRIVDFAFEAIGIRRLEARVVVNNARGNGALRKIGAVCEGILRGSFVRGTHVYDQALWAILRSEWTRAQTTWTEDSWVH